MDDSRTINGKVIKGPSFQLRGITSSKISSGHAFIVSLIFRLKTTVRNLDEKRVTAICQNENELKENNADVSITDFDCIGNETVSGDYELVRIVDYDGQILTNLIGVDIYKQDSTYNPENFPSVLLIDSQNLDQKTFNKLPINFYLAGKLTDRRDLSNRANVQLEMFNQPDKSHTNSN